jgi:hypothetical protein
VKSIISIILVAFGISGFGQNISVCESYVDVLETEIIFNEYLTDELITEKLIVLIDQVQKNDFEKKDLFLQYAAINLANLQGDPDKVLYQFIELTENCDTKDQTELRIFLGCILQISNIYRGNNANELSIQFIQKGLNQIEKKELTDYPWAQDFYNNISVDFLSKGDYTGCKTALNKALLYGKNKTPLQDAMIEYNLSFFYFEVQNIDSAIFHQENACAHFKQIENLQTFPHLYSRYGNSLGSLALFYYQNNELEKAKSTATLAKMVYDKIESFDGGRYPYLYTLINIAIDENKNDEITQLVQDIELVANHIENGKFNFFQLLSDSYTRIGNPEEEINYLGLAYSQFQIENDSVIVNLQKYNTKLQSEMLNHEKNRFLTEKTELKRQSLFNTIIISLISAFLITVLYIFYIKTRNKKDLLEKEKKISKIELEKREIKTKLTESELNEKKLVANRLASHIKLKQQTESAFLQKIKELKRTHPENIEAEISQLQVKMMNLIGIDQNYEHQLKVNDLNQEFRIKLKEQHPDLSDKEMQFCTYLTLNLTSKEIGSLTNQTDGAIRVYKNRLKNKLIGKQQMDITQYLQNI